MWDYESLFEKSKTFVLKGLNHEAPDSAEVPLWCIFALELLARATLSHIHPSLLADQKENIHILFACGFPSKTAPKSIPAMKVFQRCITICEDFSEQDYNQCMEWMNWRNEELHTGSSPFDELATSEWLPNYFRLCTILLDKSEKNLKDLVGDEHAVTAAEMIDALSEQVKIHARSLVKQQKHEFESLSTEDRLERIIEGGKRVKVITAARPDYKQIQCPTCEGNAILASKLIRSTVPKDREGTLVQEDVWLPSALGCPCCKLKIEGHSNVSALGLGDQFTTTDILDPKEYYAIEFDPSEDFIEYGNEY